MISTLEDVRKFTESVCARVPRLADLALLRAPGLSRNERLRLEHQLPGLPESYLETAERYRLETVALGYMVLAPELGGKGLVERLVVANGPASAFTDFLRAHDLYQVASREVDPIGVVRVDSRSERRGEVVWVDVESNPEFSVHPLAPDFEVFLVMAARLWDAAIRGRGFSEILGGVSLDPQQVEAWEALASMTLD